MEGARLMWATHLRFNGRAGRAMWALAAPLHHRTIPLLLGRAVRRARPA
ncbi:hypothetical protein ACIQU6_41230 [Streptomyces sp. NPDC090442]